MTTPQWVLEIIKDTKEQNSASLDLSKSGGNIEEFPIEILELTHLTELNLGFTRISGLPESIAELQNLTSLDLGYNHFTSLPETMAKLQNLTTLNLMGNDLVGLPESITKLQNLTTLNLSFNPIANLPETIIHLQNLTTLDLMDNQLNTFPEFITHLRNLISLELAYNKIYSLPKSITKMQKMKLLGLYKTELSILPEFITELQKLTNLNLGGNQFGNVPDFVFNLQNLNALFWHDNKLAGLSELIAKLPNLESLILGNNQLATLPESIIELKNLAELNLNNNEFATLPESVTKLQNLTYLDLSNNQLATLPESVTKLQNLTDLNLSNNQFTTLPESVMKLQNLTDLNLEGNKLELPPQEVAEKGIHSIREYFRQLEEQGQDQLYEAKLLILGEGGAGKTTLAKKIEDSSYVLQNEKSTEGVDITTWSFPVNRGRSFRVNIWDFGGQEIYHATHQFFLTKRSLYILVADTRKEDTDFYYWLNVVDLLSESSPLLIIKNEKQDRHRDLNERQLRGQFENLKEVLSANLGTNRGLDKIKAEIEHYMKDLPHIGSPLPKTWVRVREGLEADKRNFISLDEYLSICKENGFGELKDILQLSNYLHDLGVFLHFQDEPLLRKSVILKPKWGTDAVYKVLDNKIVIQNRGRFTRSELNAIWDAPEYENMRDELLQLMMKFKLCYEIPTQKGAYIAPQLLTENQPDHEWDEQENLLLRYSYEFMPKGILLQFIVVMSEYIWNQTVWKSGVVLEKEKTHAEIVEYYGKRQIYVRVAGVHKKELMTIVVHELDQIHSTYKKLKYDKLIPCNCKDCKVNPEPHFYKYEQLQNFVEKHIFEIQCGATGNMVNVRGLIDDVIEKAYGRDEREAPMAQYIIHGDYIDQGDKKMTDKKISITNSTVHGSVVAAESIRDSFNTIEKANIRDDLKEQLKQLNQAVEAMIKELPKEQAEEVAEDMQKLAEEAVKEKPKEKWYSVSIDGLVAAAQNIGKVGEAVIDAAGKVRKILTGGLL